LYTVASSFFSFLNKHHKLAMLGRSVEVAWRSVRVAWRSVEVAWRSVRVAWHSVEVVGRSVRVAWRSVIIFVKKMIQSSSRVM